MVLLKTVRVLLLHVSIYLRPLIVFPTNLSFGNLVLFGQQALFSPSSNPILSNRSQLVSVHGVDSDPVPVISGVPQGSPWASTFFLSISMISASLTFLQIALWSHILMILLSISLFHILLTCLTSKLI